MSAPADAPDSHTRAPSTEKRLITSRVIAASVAGSPASRVWWSGWNQFQQPEPLPSASG
jgi:hypothetical protein